MEGNTLILYREFFLSMYTDIDAHCLFSAFQFFCCCLLFSQTGCNENEADHLDRDQQPYPPSQKTKRMRTSFKHHQLRTMKSYFAINHNPDAKDLKQLAQKTGLTKRVLQVRSLCYKCLPSIPFSPFKNCISLRFPFCHLKLADSSNR